MAFACNILIHFLFQLDVRRYLMQYPNVRTIITLICLFYFAPVLMAQCDPVQIAPNCDQCTDWRKMDIEVCHGGTTYTATIEMCTQFASPPNPIDNPCTLAPNECARALDAITWVRSFYATTCSYDPDKEECEQSCNKIFDCSVDYFKGLSNVCCD